jgi:hypothetical protein
MWELAEQAPVPDKPNPSGPKTRSSPQKDASSLSRRWLWCLALGAATGLASAAAWNTKYNGWLVLAIAATAAGLWILKECLLPSVSKADGWGTRSAMLLGGLLLAAVIAVACFTHWYLYVEWRFPGGNEAVTINHRRYFSSPTAWPAHAYRLIASLAALRHYGWIATLALVPVISFRLATRPLSPEGNNQRVKSVIVSLVLSLGLAIVVLVQGGDAALLLLGIAGILPALLSGSWPRLLAAVWCGTFFVLTPLYHPYPRLMLPALPACICLSLWLLDDLWPGFFEPVQKESTSETSYPRRIAARFSLAGGAALALVWLLGPHPFGAAAPSPGIWGRWTTRASYRAAREQILEYTDADAIIFCQTQLAMYCYCPRTAVVTEDHSYRTLFEGYPRDRTCYLAVDFSWIHDTPNSEALRGILDHLDELTPVAVIPNDLCIVTLLDFLPPSEAAAKLAADLPSYRVGPEGRFPLPPPLSAPYEDVIILYRAKLPESLPP